MSRFSRDLAVQRAYDNQSEPECDESLEQLFGEYERAADKIAEADSWLEGTFDGDHYSALERAMADLDRVDPSDLPGSIVLRRLYELAKVHGRARTEKLHEMAETEYQRRIDQSEDDRAEAAMLSREDFA